MHHLKAADTSLSYLVAINSLKWKGKQLQVITKIISLKYTTKEKKTRKFLSNEIHNGNIK